MTTVESENTSEGLRCKATTKAGGPCRGWADKTGLCPAHREGARENSSKGGKASSKSARLAARMPPRLKELVDLIETSLRECHDGSLPSTRASAIASLSGALLKTLELAELEARLQSLESRLGGKEEK